MAPRHRNPPPNPKPAKADTAQPKGGYAEQRGPECDKDGWGEANPAGTGGGSASNSDGARQGRESFDVPPASGGEIENDGGAGS